MHNLRSSSPDVLHIPRDARKPDCSLGYAFINLHDAAVASQVVRAAKGLAWSSFSNSEKVCDVEFAHGRDLRQVACFGTAQSVLLQ